MSLNLAMHIMGVNLNHLDYLMKFLEVKPELICESSNWSHSKNTKQNAPIESKTQSENFLEQLQLRHTDEAIRNLNLEKFLEFCSNKESNWRNANSPLPTWKTQFTSPLRSSSSSVFHVLGGNEQLFYLENDDDGFGIPIPYDFKNDGDHGYFYANYFGDQGPYNYSGTANANELVDGILRISEIYLGERKNLASHQERTRSPVRVEDEEYEADEGNIFASKNPVRVLLEKDEGDNLSNEDDQKCYFPEKLSTGLSQDTNSTDSTSSDDEIDDWHNINIDTLIG